jgi:hypothetical protein
MYRNIDQLAYIHQAELLAEAHNERLIRSLPKAAGRGSHLGRLIALLRVRLAERATGTAHETTGAI